MGLGVIFKTWSTSIEMIITSGICQRISMNEVSKCAEINFSTFDNLHFPLDVDIEIWVLEATVQKHLLSVYKINLTKTISDWENIKVTSVEESEDMVQKCNVIKKNESDVATVQFIYFELQAKRSDKFLFSIVQKLQRLVHISATRYQKKKVWIKM